jgi:hypothetical protein
LQVLVRVLRCRRINDHLFDIGGEFVTRLSADALDSLRPDGEPAIG